MKTIYERDGKFYRRLPKGARLRPTDVAAWKRIKNIEDDPDWAQVLKIKYLVENSPETLVFLRECDPLTAAMHRALSNAGKESGM
jgi:hypothetical protein